MDEEHGLYVVCDGMGGSVGGEVASALAAQTFLQTARQELLSLEASLDRARNALWRAALSANTTVRMRAAYDTQYQGMGTTLVAAHIENDRLTLINVGDSRAYLVRHAEAHQLTMDHSYVAESVRRGLMTVEQARYSKMQSVITRAIGVEQGVEPDLFEEPLLQGDTLLLASDGLTRHVSEDEIGTILSQEGQSAMEGCRLLIEAAKEAGGSDNITCLIVRLFEATQELALGRATWNG